MSDMERQFLRSAIHEVLYGVEVGQPGGTDFQLKAICKAAEESIHAAVRITALEDALIDEIHGGGEHADRWHCPTPDTPWSRDPDCPACQRLVALIGHRAPAKEA